MQESSNKNVFIARELLIWAQLTQSSIVLIINDCLRPRAVNDLRARRTRMYEAKSFTCTVHVIVVLGGIYQP